MRPGKGRLRAPAACEGALESSWQTLCPEFHAKLASPATHFPLRAKTIFFSPSLDSEPSREQRGRGTEAVADWLTLAGQHGLGCLAEKLPEVTGTSRGNPEFPEVTRERLGETPPSSRDEGLLFLHGLESNPESSLQTPREA